jgi:hypothetical protein
MLSRDTLDRMPDWMQWVMGIVASVTAVSVAGVMQTLKDQGERLAKVEAEAGRIPTVETLLRDVREDVAAIRAKLS